MKRLSTLNEEIIYQEGDFALYKNPKFIKRMTPWKRAVSDKKGNFYVLDDPRHIETHYLIITQRLKNELKFSNSAKLSDLMKKFVMWHQVGDSNTFCLSETYKTEILHRSLKNVSLKEVDFIGDWDVRHFLNIIEKSCKKLEKTNPQYKFKQISIWDYAEEAWDMGRPSYKLKNQ